MTPTQVKERLDRGDQVRLIDVREPHEHRDRAYRGRRAAAAQPRHEWVETLSPDEEIIFFCHMGGRSHQVASFLASQRGFTKLANMLGGIDDWSLQIDPNVPRY